MNFCPPNSNMPPVSMGTGGGQLHHNNNSSNNNSNASNNLSNKEPNLMPVPSPQQIQYLNQFEGQELTIQKQPNSAPTGPGGNPQQQLMGGNSGNSAANNMMGLMDQSSLPDVNSQMW